MQRCNLAPVPRSAVRTYQRRRGITPAVERLIGPQLTSMPGRIQEALVARDMLQKELAEVLGVAPPTISRSGAKGMTLWLAAAMAKALNVRLAWLVLGEGPRDEG